MSSYGSDEGFNEWLDANGLTLPDDAKSPAILRNIGSAYLDAAYGARLTCSTKTGGFSQELQWPRTGHYFNGKAVPSDLIPTQWIYASYRAAYLEAVNPGWATASINPSRLVKRQKADVIEREFFAPSETGSSNAVSGVNVDGMIDGLVSAWLCSNTRGINDLFRVI